MKRFCVILICTISCLYMNADRMLLEAEAFSNKGGWQIDQQFMDIMGSPYIIAHGMGRPVQDAETVFNVQQTGTYNVYVRTYNCITMVQGQRSRKFLRSHQRQAP